MQKIYRSTDSTTDLREIIKLCRQIKGTVHARSEQGATFSVDRPGTRVDENYRNREVPRFRDLVLGKYLQEEDLLRVHEDNTLESVRILLLTYSILQSCMTKLDQLPAEQRAEVDRGKFRLLRLASDLFEACTDELEMILKVRQN